MAAYAFVLARTCTRVNPDEAMLTGMMHGIGKLYILTRAADHPELFASEDVLERHHQRMVSLHRQGDFGELEFLRIDGAGGGAGGLRPHRRSSDPDLTDVVGVAILMVSYGTDIGGLEKELQELPAAKRLGMNEAKTLAVMQDSAAEVTALSQALGTSRQRPRSRRECLGHIVAHCPA